LASQLSGKLETIDEIAGRAGLSHNEARRQLLQLARRGLAWLDKKGGTPYFRLAAFVVGIYEAS